MKLKVNDCQDNFFSFMDAESKLIEKLKEKNLYLESSSFAIGTKQKTVKIKSKIFRKTVDINCQIFRLKQMFTIIFNSDTFKL